MYLWIKKVFDFNTGYQKQNMWPCSSSLMDVASNDFVSLKEMYEKTNIKICKTRRSENDNTPQPLDQWTNSPFMGQQVDPLLGRSICHAQWPKVNPIVHPTSYLTHIPFIPSPREPHPLRWGPSSSYTKIFLVEWARLKSGKKNYLFLVNFAPTHSFNIPLHATIICSNPLMAKIRNPDFLPPWWWILPGLLWFGQYVIWRGIC